MGCCQSNIEIEEIMLSTLDNLNIHDPRLTQTDEGFGDLSLDSAHEDRFKPILDTSKTWLGDSVISYTRGKSISLHHPNLESAFLQSSGLLRKLSLINRSDASDHK